MNKEEFYSKFEFKFILFGVDKGLVGLNFLLLSLIIWDGFLDLYCGRWELIYVGLLFDLDKFIKV